MKGMMNLLERAGLVRRDGDEGEPDAPAQAGADPAPAVAEEAAAPVMPVEASAGMTLEQVYGAANVPPAAYPAERLLRLLDGLKAMDEGLRRQTIHAIDAADDSWTIDDPIRDASAKVAAIEAHAATIHAGVSQAEQQAQTLLAELRQRQEGSAAEIRRQISDLEGLLSRELARGAQEAAALESGLQSTKEAAARELGNLSRAATELRALIAQFKLNTTT